jgi:hypothetical protein
MNYPFLVIAGLALITLSCSEKQPAATTEKRDTATATAQDSAAPQPFFPLADFIKGEIDYVDSLPVGIKKYTTHGRTTDSGYIQLDEFHRLAREFQSPELTGDAFEKKFKETSFFDRSANTATFLYTSTDTSNTVTRADVVTAKGDIYDEVRSIYIEKNSSDGKKNVTKKMYWKPKRNFQIITLTDDGTNKPENELIKVVWDNRE